MGRKKKQITEEKIKAAQKLQELQKLEEEAQMEEEKLVAEARKKIQKIADDAGLFCGIILRPKDLAAIVEMAATNKDNVKVPFNLYFKEEETNS